MSARYSILHPTRRLPDGWVESYYGWIKRCSDASRVEYVLCVDAPNHLPPRSLPPAWGHFPVPDGWGPFVIVGNMGIHSSTPAYNTAAAASTGDLLICNADDVFPPEDWDLEIERGIKKAPWMFGSFNMAPWGCYRDPLRHEFVLHPSTNQPDQNRDEHIIFQPIMSRARYQRLGYFFYPEYLSMFADNDLTEHARQDNCVIRLSNLVLEHRHPLLGTAPQEAWDETYAHENRQESYDRGAEVLARRRANGFQMTPREGSEKLHTNSPEDPEALTPKARGDVSKRSD